MILRHIDAIILETIILRTPCSRLDLAEEAGFSEPSVSHPISRLIKYGLIRSFRPGWIVTERGRIAHALWSMKALVARRRPPSMDTAWNDYCRRHEMGMEAHL